MAACMGRCQVNDKKHAGVINIHGNVRLLQLQAGVGSISTV